jgi:hypothetical protein
MSYGGEPKPGHGDLEPLGTQIARAKAIDLEGEAVLDPLAEQVLRDKTLLWRCERLIQMGFTLQQARVTAVRRHVDLHEVERLISRGCAPHLAFDIVS